MISQCRIHSNNVVIYCRLSKDDEAGHGDSSSIQTQKQMLSQYVNEQGWRIVDYYVDDGFSGVNFDRPNFQRMINGIEDGKINCVITKDLSRLGRNYLLAGQFTEIYFPSKGVRYLALNDGVDTFYSDNDIAPFKNILNEMSSRDQSKKLRSAFNVRALNGAHFGREAHIGYKKDPNNKGGLIIDENSAWVIRKIFDYALSGKGALVISKTLREEKIPTPAYLKSKEFNYYDKMFANAGAEKAYDWNLPTVKKILKDETYIGNAVHFRMQSPNFKTRKRKLMPRENWLVIENAHEAIIDKDVFYTVQQMMASLRRETKTGEVNIFAGLLVCPDCGRKMRYNRIPYRDSYRKHFNCSTYSDKGVKYCSGHKIKYDDMYDMVLTSIQDCIKIAFKDEKSVIESLSSDNDSKRKNQLNKVKKELETAQKRQAEVDRIFAHLYEDKVNGKIDERNYTMMSAKYQAEQQELAKKITELSHSLSQSEQRVNDVTSWLDLIKKYKDIKELNVTILNELIEKIIVHEAIIENNEKTQVVEIHYRFVGDVSYAL